MPYCLVGATVFLFSACTDSTHSRKEVIGSGVETSISNEDSSLFEYIVVLDENVSIEDAISILKKYEVQVIRDLKKGRYLIGLKNDPGIEQLKKEVEGSEYIKHIQPNFTYTTQ